MADRYLDIAKDFPRRKDADGNSLCRWCGKVLPSRNMSWCPTVRGPDGRRLRPCQTEAYIRCGIDVRREVEDRDGGVCARCGRHANQIQERVLAAMRRHVERTHRLNPDAYYGDYAIARLVRGPRWQRYLNRIGQPRLDPLKSFWEAHHKHAVADGGGGCGLDGFETLCLWCHKDESKGQHARWSAERRAAKQDELPLLAMQSEGESA